MTTKITKINEEQLTPIVSARTKTLELAQVAEQAIKDARMAELEFKVQIQQLYLEKGLDSNCRVDISTGVVTWPEEIPEALEESKKTTKPSRKKTAKNVVETVAETEGNE